MASVVEAVLADLRANPRNPKAWVILSAFRCAHAVASWRGVKRVPAVLIGVGYRLAIEWGLGVEIPWKTRVAPGVRLYHGVGLVVNDGSVIETGVVLRNGVTIGHVRPGEGCPVIREGVELGANCVILGPIEIGSGSVIGAGAVVTQSIPANSLAVGVPARVIRSL